MATTTLFAHRLIHRPPHAVPQKRPRTLLPAKPHTAPQGRLGLAAVVLLGMLGLAALPGCGRSDLLEGSLLDNGDDMQVELSRELELDDSRIVLVELLAPALPAARTNLVALQDGISYDQLLTGICPDGDPEVVFNTNDVPVLEVYMDGELRALIY